MVETFVDAPDSLAKQNETQLELKFFEIGASVMIKNNHCFSLLNQSRCRNETVKLSNGTTTLIWFQR